MNVQRNYCSLSQQCKKEGKTASAAGSGEKTIRRLDIVSLGKFDSAANIIRHVVFCSATQCPRRNNAGSDRYVTYIKARKEGKRMRVVKLFCIYRIDPHGYAMHTAAAAVIIRNRFRPITMSLLSSCLKQLDGTFMASPNVKILYQSEMILLDPSNYWISVINVG